MIRVILVILAALVFLSVAVPAVTRGTRLGGILILAAVLIALGAWLGRGRKQEADADAKKKEEKEKRP